MFLSYSKHYRARGGLGSLLPCDMLRSVERDDGEKLGPQWAYSGIALLWDSLLYKPPSSLPSCCHMLGALLRLKASWMMRRSISNHAWWIFRIARIKRKIPENFQRAKRWFSVGWEPDKQPAGRWASQGRASWPPGERLLAKGPAKETSSRRCTKEISGYPWIQKVNLSCIFS